MAGILIVVSQPANDEHQRTLMVVRRVLEFLDKLGRWYPAMWETNSMLTHWHSCHVHVTTGTLL